MSEELKMEKLKECPCGETPNRIHIYNEDCKYAHAAGDCCEDWIIEFRSDYANGVQLEKLAIKAWNDTSRKEQSPYAKIAESLNSVPDFDSFVSDISTIAGKHPHETMTFMQGLFFVCQEKMEEGS